MYWLLRKSGRISLVLILWSVFPVFALSAQTGEISAARPAEYMVYQYPGIALVLRIDIPETEFSSTVFGPENALIRASGVEARRIGPVYQFVDAVDAPRQLMIKISPARTIDRSRVNLELIQLPENDYNSVMLGRAYKLLSYGMERVLATDTTTWAGKTYTLRNAAGAFSELGWEEMRLWSEFYSAHLVFHQLNDELTALELAGEVSKRASRAGFDTLELAVLVLEGDALIEIAPSADEKSAQSRFDQAHRVLGRVANLAKRLGYPSEQGRALFNRGLLYEQQGLLNEAIGQFQLALQATESAGDSELANSIRGKAASVYETLGSTSGAIGMLDDIGSELDRGKDGGEEEKERAELGRAANLFEKGRILNSNFRFPEAAEELMDALRIQQATPSDSPWGPTGLALAWAHYSMGEAELAEKGFRESIPRTSMLAHRAALRTANGAMANVFRHRKQFAEMAHYREQQASLGESEIQRAELLFDKGVDAWRRDGARSEEARRMLLASRQVAQSIRADLAVQRATLYLCLLAVEGKRGGECSQDEAARAHLRLQDGGIPSLALDAAFVWSKLLRRTGQRQRAAHVMDRLMEDLTFLNQSLPGVLGAWYWENKEDIFREYMSISLVRFETSKGAVVDGRLPLMSLERIRQLDASVVARRPAEPMTDLKDESLRALLAQRMESGGVESLHMAAEWNTQLAELRGRYTRNQESADTADLREVIANLGRDEVILAFYFGIDSVYRFLASGDGVHLRRLQGSATIQNRLLELRSRIAAGDGSLLPQLDELGSLMLGSESGHLKKRIYLLPTGPLIGLPFDALRLDGRFLAERHQVINLMSLAAIERNATAIGKDYREKVFLAGNPQAGQRLFEYDVTVSAEIDAVTDLFVGPGLQIVQGLALDKEEFHDVSFSLSNLLHLAAPGRLDLAFPERSRLRMSVAADEPANAHLAPRDIGTLNCAADLLVLSQTGVTNEDVTRFDSRIGIVSDFLDSCVDRVVATLWPAGDPETTAFVTDFYRELESSLDVSEALSQTKSARIGKDGVPNFRTWAGFQLHIR